VQRQAYAYDAAVAYSKLLADGKGRKARPPVSAYNYRSSDSFSCSRGRKMHDSLVIRDFVFLTLFKHLGAVWFSSAGLDSTDRMHSMLSFSCNMRFVERKGGGKSHRQSA
jgi:hypothetical protein